jgi:DNA-binding NarL/FixJ family response regulator
MNRFSVLVVQRDDGINQILNCLNSQFDDNASLETAESLGAALALQAHYLFDIILVDPDLADSQGLETIRRLVSAAPESAVIVISENKGDESTAVRSLRYGAQDYIEKRHLSPFALGKAIIYAIERKNILQEKVDLLADLTSALEKLETLQSILRLCAGCQKIYDEHGKRWLDVDSYVETISSQRPKALCPDCRRDLKFR